MADDIFLGELADGSRLVLPMAVFAQPLILSGSGTGKTSDARLFEWWKARQKRKDESSDSANGAEAGRSES